MEKEWPRGFKDPRPPRKGTLKSVFMKMFGAGESNPDKHWEREKLPTAEERQRRDLEVELNTPDRLS